MKRSLSVLVDHREPIDQCIYEFKKYYPDKLEIISLEVGDYFINSRLLFERKTMRDFIRSISDGRLFSQAEQLKCSNIKSALLLEGDDKDLRNLNSLRPALQGAIIKLSLGFDIPVIRSNHFAESVQLMVFAAYQRPAKEKISLPRRRKATKSRYQARLQLLQVLPHIGFHRAKLLINHFGTMRQIFNATYEELQLVPGIGSKIAEEIILIIDNVKRKSTENATDF